MTSPNWSGYVVTGSRSNPVMFSSATGTWTVPRVHCHAGEASTSEAVWVGLAGYVASERRQGEQIGSEAECEGDGRQIDVGWFEIVPFPAYTIPRRLVPGDTVTGTVTVRSARRVELTLTDWTRRWIFSRTISLFGRRGASAEWIVAAPETCILNRCKIGALGDFGSVRIRRIAAHGSSSTGTLADPAWQTIAVQLVSTASDPPHPAHSPLTTSEETPVGALTATPGRPSPDGSAFTDYWVPPVAAGRSG